VTAPVTSVAPTGNRVRVQVGPVVAEITGVSAERLRLTPGATVTASFKATTTRLYPADGGR
jgi:molybdate transport system ATP-binding protein